MKRTIALFALSIALIMLCGALCACSGSNEESGVKPGAPFNDSTDMAVVINGVTYSVRTDSANVLSALGNDYDYSETVSCIYEGYDKAFAFDDITVSTVPVDGKDIIEMFTLTGGDYATARGIKVGDTRQKVLEAYGEHYTSDDGYYLTYTQNGDPNDYSAMRVMFKMNGDTVEEICVYSPSYTNG